MSRKDRQVSSTKKSKLSNIVFILVALIILVPALYAGYVYASSPEVILKPKLEHYHFRMQVLVNGSAENFAQDKYQQAYSKDQCNGSLPEQPIHFHDHKDQFVHIHWEGMTGGMVMKYYGWNYIGGLKNALGYKVDGLRDIKKVNIHGHLLPSVPDNSEFFVYTGDAKSYKQRSFTEWLDQDLEQFFAKTSNFPAHKQNTQSGFIDRVFPRAVAHGAEDTSPPTTGTTSEAEEQRLTQLNNLIGNVVIFVQKDKPTDTQIKDRFNHLEPLSESTCGG